MGIHICISMPREMLCGTCNTAIAQTAVHCNSEPGHLLFILIEGAGIKNVLPGIIVHIRYRRIIHLYLQLPALLCNCLSNLINKRIGLQCPQLHKPWERWYLFITHTCPPLSIKGYEHWNFCPLVQLVHLLHCREKDVSQWYKATYFFFLYKPLLNCKLLLTVS